MPLMSGGDAVVRSVLAHGISTIYALPGVQSDHLFNAMFDAGDALSVVHTRHEQGAAYMALGAALATGKPAAYSVVPGPGFLNSTAALATAYSTGARVLALIGQIPSRGIGKGHGLLHEIPDQIGILRRLTKWAERVDTPQHGPDIIARAFQSLQSGRPRPVGVELPPDMLAARAEVEMSSPLPPRRRSAARRGRDRARRRSAGESGVSGDLRRRRRARCRRRGARARRAARRAGRVLSPRHAACSTIAIRSATRCRAAMRCGRRPMSCSRSARGCSFRSRTGAPTTSSRSSRSISTRKSSIAFASRRSALPAMPPRCSRVSTSTLRICRPRGPIASTRSRALKERISASTGRACAAARLSARDPRRPARRRRPDRRADPGRLHRAQRLRDAQAAHLHLVRLPGHARLGRCHRARRQARARGRAGRGAQRRRRLHVQCAGALDRGAPSHPAW